MTQLPVYIQVTFIVLTATLFTFGWCAPSSASPPPINQSTVEPTIIGTVSGELSIASNDFRTRILDFNNTPIAGSVVRLDFSATALRLYDVQNSGITVNCAARTLSKLSDAQGYAIFNPRFGGFTNSNLIEVSADGVVLALVKARSVDIDAAGGGISVTDFAQFEAAYTGQQPHPEMNFDESVSNVLNLGDFLVFSDQYLRSANGTYCP